MTGGPRRKATIAEIAARIRELAQRNPGSIAARVKIKSVAHVCECFVKDGIAANLEDEVINLKLLRLAALHPQHFLDGEITKLRNPSAFERVEAPRRYRRSYNK